MKNIILTGTGSFIPKNVVKNEQFLDKEFFDENGNIYPYNNEEIIQKFQEITGIGERRYLPEDMNTSDAAALAGKKAIEVSGIDPETLDYIIVGHNVGEINPGSHQSELIPSLASRVKFKLQIKNPKTIAMDVIFGCPGWLQGVINSIALMRSGMASKVMVIGAEALSRSVDKHGRDSMIFADGAGATIFELRDEPEQRGILSYTVVSHTLEESKYLFMSQTYKKDSTDKTYYIKMMGRKIYEYALSKVPLAMKEALDKSNVSIDQIKKVFIHQANEKMDYAIVQRFFKLYGIREMNEHVMPMSIQSLGNSSTATIPTLLDSVLSNKCEVHEINEGDIVLIASVGAGMNINAIVYKF